VREAGDITDVADDQGGNNGTDPADLGQARCARLDRGYGALGVVGQRAVHAAQVGEQVAGQMLAHRATGGHGADCGAAVRPLAAA
jgi:hypothetical protein